MTFHDCVIACAGQAELVAEFDRLTGHNLSLKGSPLDLEIDKATGRLEEGMRDFVGFVYECIWARLPEIQTDTTISGE